jgi:hypothetical protein
VEAGDRGTPIVLSEDDSPTPPPNVDKIQKLTPSERAELGWESPPGWEYDNESIAARIAKLKKRRDGEVENPAVQSTPPGARAATSEASTPVSGSRRSHRIMGSDAEPVLQKAIRATALKNATGTIPSEAFVSFPAFSDDHFLGVAADSSLVFDSSFGSPHQVISLVRAKEVAQALLAEAIVKASAAQQVQPVPEVPLDHTAPSSTVQSDGGPMASPSDSAPLAQWDVCQQKVRAKNKKRKAVTQVLGPRLNLRNTPARQARAANQVSQ